MIKFILTVGALALALGTQAQAVNSREGFRLSSSKASLHLSPGQSDSLYISILRSKQARGAAKFRLTSSLPEHVSATLTPRAENPDQAVLIVRALESAKPASFYLLPLCEVNYQSKGITLKVEVKP